MTEQTTSEFRDTQVDENQTIQENNVKPSDSRSAAVGIGLGCLVWVIIGFMVAALLSNDVRAFLNKWWWAVLVVIVILEGLLVGVPSLRRHATTKTRVAIIIFVVIPLLLIPVVAVFFIPLEFQAPCIRGIFVIIVSFLPAVMYYLFITTTKFSILNEFVTNLCRLGLLGGPAPQSGSSITVAFQRRTATYIRKFEAVYGALPADSGIELMSSPDPSSLFADSTNGRVRISGLASVFTSETRIPVILSTILVALGWLIVLGPWQCWTEVGWVSATATKPWIDALTPCRSPVYYAFLGAYFFSIQMLFRRYVRRDLRASAYVSVSLRIILALIGIWVAIAVFSALQPKASDEALLVVGFVIGAFPPVVWQVIQATVKKFGPVLVLPSLQAEMPLSELDGLTVWHESRLEEEDIENVPNMATADMVELMLHTRFSPDRIVDWIDQAILYTHLGPERGKKQSDSSRERLRLLGIRTASSLVAVYDSIGPDTDQRRAFEKILGDYAYSPVRSLIDALKTNTNLQLIQTWQCNASDK